MKNKNSFWGILAYPLIVATFVFLYFVVWPSFYPPPPETTTIVAGIGLAIFLTAGIITIHKLDKKFKNDTTTP